MDNGYVLHPNEFVVWEEHEVCESCTPHVKDHLLDVRQELPTDDGILPYAVFFIHSNHKAVVIYG